MLLGEPSTASQSSTGAHTERIAATQNHMLSGGHWLPPSSGASGSPTGWVSCRLHRLYCSSFCLWSQLSCCISLFAKPRVGKAWAKWLQGDWRSHRNYRHIYSLPAGAAAVAADTLVFSPLWLTRQTQPWDSSNATAFQVDLTYTYCIQPVTKPVTWDIHAQRYTWSQLWHKPCDMHVQCYKWSQLLHSHHLQNVGWQSLNNGYMILVFFNIIKIKE